MKTLKKLMALTLAFVMMMALAIPMAGATATTQHEVTITTNGNCAHTYTAYQIFVGSLDASGEKLSNITWGSSVSSSGQASIISALKSDGTLKTKFPATDASGGAIPYTAASVAAIVSGFNADEIERFCDIVEPYLTNPVDSEVTSGGTAALNVTGDGYYLFKDTGTIANGDTSTKFIVRVVNDLEIRILV